MASEETPTSRTFWYWVGTIALGVMVGTILLCIEYKSGLFQATSPKPFGRATESNQHEPIKDNAVESLRKDVSRLHLKPDIKLEPIKRTDTPSPKSELGVVDLAFDHFAKTIVSLSENDQATYLQSLAAKKVTWTGFIGQLYLTDNYLYMWPNEDGHDGVKVSVQFKNDLRLNLGPPKTKIRVSGTIEIRNEWVVIEATEITICR